MRLDRRAPALLLLDPGPETILLPLRRGCRVLVVGAMVNVRLRPRLPAPVPVVHVRVLRAQAIILSPHRRGCRVLAPGAMVNVPAVRVRQQAPAVPVQAPRVPVALRAQVVRVETVLRRA